MPPSTRYTLRLPPALDAAVQEQLRTTGTPFAVLMRDALTAYLADTPPTGRPTPADNGADTTPTGADTAAPRRPGRPSSPLRQQILDLLQGHPEGLSAEAIRVYVHATRPIGDTLAGIVRGGVIIAQGRGADRRYVVAA